MVKYIYVNFMELFYGWGSTASKLQSHYREAVFVSDWSWSGARQEFNTIIKNLKCMMDETNISLSDANKQQ